MFRRAIKNKIMNAINEEERVKKGQAKSFEQKKMLKARVFQLIKRLMDEKPICQHYTKT